MTKSLYPTQGYSTKNIQLSATEIQQIKKETAKYFNTKKKEAHAEIVKYKQKLKQSALKKSKSDKLTREQNAEIMEKVQQFTASLEEDLKYEKQMFLSSAQQALIEEKAQQNYQDSKEKASREWEEERLNQPSMLESFMSGISKIKQKLSYKNRTAQHNAQQQGKNR